MTRVTEYGEVFFRPLHYEECITTLEDDMAIVESTPNAPSLPYGTLDLEPEPVVVSVAERRVRCFVRGCRQIVDAPTRSRDGSICPEHRIRCHYSMAGPTYSYAEPERNLIVDGSLAGQRLFGHPFKYESDRLGHGG